MRKEVGNKEANTRKQAFKSPGMSEQTANNKRIAKNTLLLYVRMLLIMVVSLWTSRVIMQALGVEDYGIHNVVGGVVTMFTMLSGTLSASISRFITFELGKGDIRRLKVVFSSSITIQLGLSLLVLLLAETVGLWFLNQKMVIPSERLYAANWVYQFSVLAFIVNLISVPYHATIVAHERMATFAYISIVDASLRLLSAYLVMVSLGDRLIVYAFLLTLSALLVRMLYTWYCKREFEECTYRFMLDRPLLKQMFSFAGWNFIGATSGLLRDQGGNILMNLFFGPMVNAARAIAFQVNIAVNAFVTNFMTALNPQITKSFATGDTAYLMTLLYKGARFSYFILLLLSLPVLANTHFLLLLWLREVPDYAVSFVQLSLLLSMCECFSIPLVTAMLATGQIRNYQIVVGGFQLLNLPISYLFLKWGYAPEAVFVVAIFISQCCFLLRIYMLRSMIGLSVRTFLRKVYLNIISVTLGAAAFPLWLSSRLEESWGSFFALLAVSEGLSFAAIYVLGCETEERSFIKSKVKSFMKSKT